MCEGDDPFDKSLLSYHKATRATRVNLTNLKRALDDEYKLGDIEVKKKVLQVSLRQRHSDQFVGWLRVPRPSN